MKSEQVWVVLYSRSFPELKSIRYTRRESLRAWEKIIEYLFPYPWKRRHRATKWFGIKKATVVKATLTWEAPDGQ